MPTDLIQHERLGLLKLDFAEPNARFTASLEVLLERKRILHGFRGRRGGFGFRRLKDWTRTMRLARPGAWKALKFLPNHREENELRGGFNVDAYSAGTHKQRGYICLLRTDAILRFRYYAENMTELRIRINSKGDKESWIKTVDSISNGKWTSLSIPLREFKANGGSAGIANGTMCAEFFATAYGKNALTVYWDDVEITSPEK